MKATMGDGGATAVGVKARAWARYDSRPLLKAKEPRGRAESERRRRKCGAEGSGLVSVLYGLFGGGGVLGGHLGVRRLVTGPCVKPVDRGLGCFLSLAAPHPVSSHFPSNFVICGMKGRSDWASIWGLELGVVKFGLRRPLSASEASKRKTLKFVNHLGYLRCLGRNLHDPRPSATCCHQKSSGCSFSTTRCYLYKYLDLSLRVSKTGSRC